MGADNFADATAVTIATDGGTYTESGVDNSTFTMESGEPLPTGFPSGRSAWWKYTPASSGTVSVDTNPTTGYDDTELAVYTGSAVNALTKIASDSDSGTSNRSALSFAATAGVTYYIQVTCYNSNVTSYGVNVTGPATAAPAPTGSVAASLPAPTVALSGTYAQPTVDGSLVVNLPTPSAALAGAYTPPNVDGSLVVGLPATAASLSGTYIAPGSADGALDLALPVLVADLAGAYTEPAPTSVGTDTTSDVTTGYGYDGYGTVGDDLTADPIPAGVHLPKIMRVHQSLPAPTLVDGRPT